ncbi:MAG: septal ring lytic transglycosylase RlpA family protein [Prevotella sp.]|nr:septal ring lytic transglycosylase RlpA family protein [Prevotella sp.]
MMAQTHRGKASYYSRQATGARTASGDRLHHDSLTCAHRNYPFGTMLKVTNLANGKEVYVKVTDRGPYGRGRIVDLSYGAARELGMLAQGVAMVEVQRVDGITPPYRMDETERGLPDIKFGIKDLGSGLIVDVPTDKESKRKAINSSVSNLNIKAKINPVGSTQSQAPYNKKYFSTK